MGARTPFRAAGPGRKSFFKRGEKKERRSKEADRGERAKRGGGEGRRKSRSFPTKRNLAKSRKRRGHDLDEEEGENE